METETLLQESVGSPVKSTAVFVRDLSLSVPNRRNKKETKFLLDNISFDLPEGTFTAIVGPSGCGKTTLIRLLAGLRNQTSGEVRLAGHTPGSLRAGLPLAIGYLPQFSALHDSLTVRETLEDALAIRLPGSVPKAQRRQWFNSVVDLAGLSGVLDQACETLSGGQKRRLSLAEELIGDPPFLFLDELTSGLDPNADLEMMQWMRDLVRRTGKTVVMVTHSVANLDQCDKVLFLNAGKLLFAGAPEEFLPAFGAGSIEEIYATAGRYDAAPYEGDQAVPEPRPLKSSRPANAMSQFGILMRRQVRLLFRDKGQLGLQLLLLISFPVLVAVFALDGLPAVQSLSLEVETSVVEGLAEQLSYLKESFDVASLVQGLAMFQVILLTLMGANNGAREIAKEAPILQKELRAGLSAFSYCTTKVIQVTLFSAIQSFWMTWFVKEMCGFPGSFADQYMILFLATAAMSNTCLLFSAISRTPEKASLLSIYLVGLQLPLSGAVLALPELLRWATQPVIAAYWGWSGYLRTLEMFRQYDVVQQASKTEIAISSSSVVVLSAHIIVGWMLVVFAIKRSSFRSE
ncbi:MAG: hypothetical protein CMO55_28610 [Verrucomicrobiales bacterium]|nr:hypothetical protein [Verrucomicrobiales bacterium]